MQEDMRHSAFGHDIGRDQEEEGENGGVWKGTMSMTGKAKSDHAGLDADDE